MDIKHWDCLSWFSRKGESHEQDGERLCRARLPRAKTASGDPAMAFMSSDASTGAPWRPGLRLDGLIALQPDGGHKVSAHKRADNPRGTIVSGECRASR